MLIDVHCPFKKNKQIKKKKEEKVTTVPYEAWDLFQTCYDILFVNSW